MSVVGGGPAGLAAALALARLGQPIGLFAQPAGGSGAAPDGRTAALFAGSIAFLRNLGVWKTCEPESAPITGIRIIDDTGGLLRAPEVLFTARELGLETFGYNVPNTTLSAALREALTVHPRAHIRQTAGVTDFDIGEKHARLRLAEGDTVESLLIAGADGRASPSRTAAGIATHTWSYPQSALVCSFSHGRSHGGVSTELHRPPGPLTTVPLPGLRSSLVWVERPEEAKRLREAADGAFCAELELRLQGLLGTIDGIGPRSVFPLSGMSAETAGQRRVALIGEACHVIPPIGAQGLNLGLRDAAELADCVADALRAGRDIGGPETLAAYSKARAADIATRIAGVDLLNRTLIAGLLPTHLARGAGLHLLSAIGPLKRLFVREGLEPALSAPSLMHPGGAAILAARLGTPAAAESPAA